MDKEITRFTMKVLLITECYPRKEKKFSGVYLKQQFDAFQNLGHTVDVCILRRGQNEELQQNLEEGYPYYTIGYTTDRYELLPGIKLKPYYHSISHLIEEKKYDLISIHLVSDSALITTIKLANHFEIPAAVHFHGLNVWNNYRMVHPFREKLYAARRKRVLKKAKLLIGVSDKVSDVIRQKIKNVPVETVYNGVDVDFFQSDDATSNALKIVSVARLEPTKGLDILIKAFAVLAHENKDVFLEIIGDGPEEKKLEETAKACSVADKVLFDGRLPYDQVAKRMRESDLFVLPSYYEALGCVYLEAMACGLPAIGVKGMGIDEIIEDGVNGYNMPPQDEKALSEIMQKLFEDRTLLKEMGRNARKTAEQYSWAASAKTLEQVYNECIKS